MQNEKRIRATTSRIIACALIALLIMACLVPSRETVKMIDVEPVIPPEPTIEVWEIPNRLIEWEPTPAPLLFVPRKEAPELEQEEIPQVEINPIREDIPLDAETQRLLMDACEEMGIEFELALAIIWKETGYRNVVGDNGDSTGYMQVQEKWQAERMERLGVTDLSDPESNFRVGLDILAELIVKYDGNVEMALVGYNMGPTGAYTYCFSQGQYYSKYSQAVLGKYEELKGGA